jgi:hypothetical protein
LGGGLLFLGLFFRQGWTRLDALLWSAVLAVVVGHYFYWCGHLLTFGTFYWYEALPCLLWAGLRGGARAAEALRASGLPAARRALALLIALGSLWGLARVVPAQAWALRGYAGVDAGLSRVVEPLGPAMRGLVLVEGQGPLDYHAAFALQPPFLDERFIYARSRGPAEDRMLASYFPSRRALLWDGKLLRPLPGTK